VISDGVFPVTGAIAPVPDYINVLESYDNSIICTDDAHAVGVIGEKGQGCYEYHSLSHPRLFSSATLSKAFGGYGGIIACSLELREKLINNARVCFASSAPPVPAAGASAKALEVLYNHPEVISELWDNVAHTKKGFRSLGFEVDETPVPIIPLFSDTADIKTLPEKLKSRGIVISRFYTGGDDYSSVPEGGCVRIALFANHSKEQIDRLIKAIGEVISLRP
jgi:glycine C-acetyltransferase/8-amino-7-oxononanoate synthase